MFLKSVPGGGSGFICRVTLFNGDNQGYVLKVAVSQKVCACMVCVLSLGDQLRVHNFHRHSIPVL